MFFTGGAADWKEELDVAMEPFSDAELKEIDTIWRALPEDHVWCGWASVGQPVTEVFIYRTRAHWRRFVLVREDGVYKLQDEPGRLVARDATLPGLLAKVEAIPGLKTAYLPEDQVTKPRG